MFESLYRWAMRSGPRLLFGAAAILLVLQLIQAIWEIGRFGPNNELQANWLMVIMRLLNAFSLSIMPLFGALLINRIDRYLMLREGDSGSG